MKMERALALLAFGLLFGCQGLLGPDGKSERRVGAIEFYGDSAQISVPDIVTAGTPFTVSVTTYGGGCVSADGTDSAVSNNAAEVTPYDSKYIPPAGTGCPSILKLFEHRATLEFTQPGSAVVQVHGRREPGGEHILVTRSVLVRTVK